MTVAPRKRHAAKTYRATPGADFGQKKAQVYGRALEALGETVTAPQVLDAARSKQSPLHGHFDWRDSSAAEKWRLVQARHLLNHLEVVIVVDGVPQNHKAFTNVSIRTEEDEHKQAYHTLRRVLSTQELAEKHRQDLLGELRALKARYQQFAELIDAFIGTVRVAQPIGRKKSGKKGRSK